MTHNFFLNLMSVFFPVLCLVLAFVPDDFNDFINMIANWFYKRFNVAATKRQQFSLNTNALRIFGIIGLLFTLTMILLMFYRPTV